MIEATVKVASQLASLPIRINGSDPNFRIATDAIEAAMIAPLDDVTRDLLDIACVIFAADGSVRRGGLTRPHMGEDWHREFGLRIPVRCPDLWRGDVSRALEEAVGFLTGDKVQMLFLPRPADIGEQHYLDFDAGAASFQADEVILFSGGLDSFAGALDALSTRPGKVALVTHRSAQKAVPRQVELGKYLARRFPGRVLHIHVTATRVGSVAPESTQRSRSFLFAALGHAVARSLGAPRLSFYENGIISHNLPISSQVVGTMATRTTHPLSLHLVNAVLGLVDAASVPIRNPFAWLTKTEVVQRIAEHGGRTQIRHTVSCTNVRQQDTLHTHCGSCSQCLDRRFAVLAAGLGDEDPADMYATDVLCGERPSERSRTMAIDWSRSAILIHDLDDKLFLTRFGQELMRIARGHPELGRNHALKLAFELYKRQASAVIGVLRAEIARSSDLLAKAALPESSLLRLHIAGGNSVPADPRATIPATAAAKDISSEASDLVPQAGAALEVSFFMELGRHVIAVAGLCRVEGRPAEVGHTVKPIFDEDRARGLRRIDCRYLAAGTMAVEMKVSSEAINQYVRRCRKTLHHSFHQVHGIAPARELLIESKRPVGYRLDPDIRIIGQEQPEPA